MTGTGLIMEGNFTNTSNDSQDCHLMSNKEFITTTALTKALNSFTCLACIIAILLIVFLKDYKRFLIRLLLYLNLTVFFFMLAEIIETLPVKNEDGVLVIHNKDFCTAAGFFGVLFASLFLLTKFSTALYLVHLSTSKSQENLHRQGRACPAYEICGVITAVTIAIVMAIVPLIPIDGDTAYGLIGTFCWIEQDPDCQQSVVGVVEQILLWHMPLLVTFAFMTFALVLGVRALCKKPSKNMKPTEEDKYMEARKEARTLTVYVIIFIILYLVNMTIHLLYVFSKEHHKIYVIVLAAVVVQPLVLLSVPAAFIFHPATLKRLRCNEVKQMANKWRGEDDAEVYTNYHVSQELSDCSDLVIKGSDGHKLDATHRCMLERPNIQEA